MAETLARRIGASSKYRRGLDLLLEAIREETARFEREYPKPASLQPDADASHRLKEIASSLEHDRGRPLYYPFIGSGAGRGAWVELLDGSWKLDCITGIGTHFFGHSDPDLVACALRAATSDVAMQGHLQMSPDLAALSRLLIRHSAPRLRHVWLSISGTMANDNALKIIYQRKHPADLVVAFSGNFAGRSIAMAEITDKPAYRKGLPLRGSTLYVPFYDSRDGRSTERSLDALNGHIKSHPGRIAAFLFELIQGEAGVRMAPRKFFEPLIKRCAEEDIAIWFDEVQTFGRTGEIFAFQKLGLDSYPDVVTVGKMLLGSAVLFTEEMNPDPSLLAGTFAGSSVCLALGQRIIERLIGEGFLGPEGRIEKIERLSREGLSRAAERLGPGTISDIRACGTMVAFQPLDGSRETAQRVVQECFQRGLLTFPCGSGPYGVRLLLPGGAITPPDLDFAFETIADSLKAIRSSG